MLDQIVAILGTVAGIILFGYLFGELVPFVKKEGGEGKLYYKHTALKIILLVFCLNILFFVPKVVWENQEYCQFVLNETDEVSYTFQGDTTSNITHHYAYVCIDNTSETANSLFNLFSWVLRIVYMYGFLMAIYLVLHYIDRMRKRL